jgi:plastocyanin
MDPDKGGKTMLRVLGSLVTTALLLGISACTTGSQTNNSPTNANSSPTATITATASPTATATATVAPGSPSPGGAPTTAAVKATNFKWTDSVSGTNVTTIKVGGTITFTAQGNHKLAHDTSSVGNGCGDLEASFDSTPITQPVTRTLNKVGTFGYHCGVHGGTPNCNNPSDSDGMAAVIKVVP